LLLVACTGESALPARATEIGAVREVSTSAADGEHCADVGARWVCSTSAVVRVLARPLPDDALPPDLFWRCEGERPRRCALTQQRPFVCREGVCRQRYPRLPDDADWECAEVDGLVVCRDRAPPAGIVRGPRELGWICSDTRPRICIDLAPDRPGAGNYDCRFVHEPVLERTCRPRDAPTLGGPCRGSCPAGLACVSGICAPETIAPPSCWTDADCERGERCVLARCS
jgi:hypothetical protein